MVEQEVVDCLNDIIIIVERREKKRLYNKEYLKQYREKHKDKIRLRNKEYSKQYYHENKEKELQRMKEYNQTEEGVKSGRIANWKCRGVKCSDFEELYNQYCRTAFCDYCGVELTEDKKTTPTRKVLDHCHISGDVRNILCHSCNVKRKQSNF